MQNAADIDHAVREAVQLLNLQISVVIQRAEHCAALSAPRSKARYFPMCGAPQRFGTSSSKG